jgi:hypothetical protein
MIQAERIANKDFMEIFLFLIYQFVSKEITHCDPQNNDILVYRALFLTQLMEAKGGGDVGVRCNCACGTIQYITVLTIY